MKNVIRDLLDEKITKILLDATSKPSFAKEVADLLPKDADIHQEGNTWVFDEDKYNALLDHITDYVHTVTCDHVAVLATCKRTEKEV